MDKKKDFNKDRRQDVLYLSGFLQSQVAENISDEQVITTLQDRYTASAWFSVISFAEQFIYGATA